MTYYKALKAGRRATNADYRYPTQGWTKHLAPETLTLCKIGYHIARDSQVLGWLNEELWEAEPCPDHPVVGADDKVVTCKVRLVRRVDGWNERTARLFAADCAEMTLLGERASGREPDERSWAAVGVVRRYAVGDATAEDLVAARDAARDAAWAAARDAARAAARDAAWDAARERLYARLRLYLDGAELPPVEPLYGVPA